MLLILIQFIVWLLLIGLIVHFNPDYVEDHTFFVIFGMGILSYFLVYLIYNIITYL